MNEWTKNMIEEVEKFNANTPDGQIIDADTILVDLIQNCDHEFTGFAQDIFNIWKESTDKKAVEQMFYEFTGLEFDAFLTKCKEEITTPDTVQKFSFSPENLNIDDWPEEKLKIFENFLAQNPDIIPGEVFYVEDRCQRWEKFYREALGMSIEKSSLDSKIAKVQEDTFLNKGPDSNRRGISFEEHMIG